MPKSRLVPWGRTREAIKTDIKHGGILSEYREAVDAIKRMVPRAGQKAVMPRPGLFWSAFFAWILADLYSAATLSFNERNDARLVGLRACAAPELRWLTNDAIALWRGKKATGPGGWVWYRKL